MAGNDKVLLLLRNLINNFLPAILMNNIFPSAGFNALEWFTYINI